MSFNFPIDFFSLLQDASEYQCESGEPPRYVPHKPITGVIGASFSTESIMVANILRLFKVKCHFLFGQKTEMDFPILPGALVEWAFEKIENLLSEKSTTEFWAQLLL